MVTRDRGRDTSKDTKFLLDRRNKLKRSIVQHDDYSWCQYILYLKSAESKLKGFLLAFVVLGIEPTVFALPCISNSFLLLLWDNVSLSYSDWTHTWNPSSSAFQSSGIIGIYHYVWWWACKVMHVLNILA